MAFVREVKGRVLEVKEKASFTDNPFAEHASSGVYHFRRGEYLKRYAQEQIAQRLTHNGEFYVTLMYNLLIKDGLNVGYFDTEFFACLGTPEEVRNFEAWSTLVRNPHLRTPHGVANCYHYWSGYWNEQNSLERPLKAVFATASSIFTSWPPTLASAMPWFTQNGRSSTLTQIRRATPRQDILIENVLEHIISKGNRDRRPYAVRGHLRQVHRRGGPARRTLVAARPRILHPGRSSKTAG
jgi:hypothetical protein